MNQFPAIERRVAQHYPQLEEAILAALVAEGKNGDQVEATDLAAVDHFHTLTAETCFIESTSHYRDCLEEPGFEVVKQRDRLHAARAFFRRETEKVEAR
jgi:hypothetical protein